MQATPSRAKQCPHCGERLPGNPQHMLYVLGIVGVVFLAAVIGLATFLQPQDDERGDSQQQSAPAAPAKKPPLN